MSTAPVTQTCYFCGTEGARLLNWSHWIVTGEGKFGGEYIRVDYCDECRGKIIRYKAPKVERVARTAPTVATYSDYAMLGRFLGAGKKSRR